MLISGGMPSTVLDAIEKLESNEKQPSQRERSISASERRKAEAKEWNKKLS